MIKFKLYLDVYTNILRYLDLILVIYTCNVENSDNVQDQLFYSRNRNCLQIDTLLNDIFGGIVLTYGLFYHYVLYYRIRPVKETSAMFQASSLKIINPAFDKG
jgi:hypothetical protein